jgi:ribosomal protein S5
MSATQTPQELLAAFVCQRWRAEDGGAVIAQVRDGQGRPHIVKGPPDAGPTLLAGVTYRWMGRWEDHDKYGRQFAFAAFSAVVGGDKRGVVAYLQAVADNVGEKRAERLWDAYGPLAVEALRNDPEGVASKGIMSLDDAREAAQTLHDEAAFEAVKIALLGMFTGRGFGNRAIKECIRLWRHRAAEFVRRNPYLLLLRKVPGCGWKRVDKLFLDLGHNPARLKRQTLVAVAELRNGSTGDTWRPAQSVGEAIVKAVPVGADPVAALRLGIRARVIVRRKDRAGEVWLAEGAKGRNEAAVAEHVRRIAGWTLATSRGSSENAGLLWPNDDTVTSATDA